MNLLLLLDMAAAARPDERAVVSGTTSLSYGELLAAAWSAAGHVEGTSALVYVGTNHLAVPVGVFASAAAGVPFVPLNYRLGAEQLDHILGRHEDAVIVASGPSRTDLAESGYAVQDADDFVAAARGVEPTSVGEVPEDADPPAALLYTSGTSGPPKAAILRHRHLTAYVIGAVEFGSARPDEAVLVAVPPYHIAGLANLISNVYLGRRIVYLASFDAEAWLATVRAHAVTHATVVPTMLARICDALDRSAGGAPPSLRSVLYGGAHTPRTVLERALTQMPHVGFTNAYGLTETSSTISVLGPKDHRAALSGDPAARARLASTGRVLPAVEVEVRGPEGSLPSGEVGELWVRGEQVSGEYVDQGAALDPDGWFPTRDRGWLDPDGYLFVEGRADDTIIRGGENVAPAEIEAVLLRHPAVQECAVVGIPDDEWGQRIAAAVVLAPGSSADEAELQAFVRRSLRSSKTPDLVRFTSELPYNDTGKLLRRSVQAMVR